MRHLVTLAAAAALVATAGCDALSGVAGAAVGAAGGPKVAITGKVYAPATQVAIVAAGGLNFKVTARADESPVPGAKVAISGGPSAVTDNAGGFKLELAGSATHWATVSYSFKDNKGSASLPAVIVAGAAASSVELDAANYMVAAKGKGKDGAKLTAAITAMRSALQSASKVPEFTDEAGASAAFDANANAAVKTALGL